MGNRKYLIAFSSYCSVSKLSLTVIIAISILHAALLQANHSRRFLNHVIFLLPQTLPKRDTIMKWANHFQKKNRRPRIARGDDRTVRLKTSKECRKQWKSTSSFGVTPRSPSSNIRLVSSHLYLYCHPCKMMVLQEFRQNDFLRRRRFVEAILELLTVVIVLNHGNGSFGTGHPKTRKNCINNLCIMRE